eukprot:GILK01015318.1.p1 GENE.GILK01015318.1~~GILK01015318.1.p1  ORF type:complete len:157 (-),score=10.86 GILK01015318.1:639-1109(-)
MKIRCRTPRQRRRARQRAVNSRAQLLRFKGNPKQEPLPQTLKRLSVSQSNRASKLPKLDHEDQPDANVANQRAENKDDPTQTQADLEHLRSQLELVDHQILEAESRYRTLGILNDAWQKNKDDGIETGVERICLDTTAIENRLRQALDLKVPLSRW